MHDRGDEYHFFGALTRMSWTFLLPASGLCRHGPVRDRRSPPAKLRRQWTGAKFEYLAHARVADIGTSILKHVIFTCNPRPIGELINQVNIRDRFRGFTHPTGSRPHHSSIAVRNGLWVERRYYFRSRKIEWTHVIFRPLCIQ